ncbi:MAG: RNA polymerase sigma factor, partial [Terriglobales bacterium]
PGGIIVMNPSISKDAAVSQDKNPGRNETDLELVKRAQQGDSEAFAALFHAHKGRVYSICMRMTNNTAQAEDLTQDAFLQVFRKLSTFKGNSALSTWLYRIAVNTVLMHFRKKALKQISLDEPSSQDAKQVRREYGSRDGRLSGSVDRITLTRAIKDLPAGYRKIFLLHEVEGYEHQEIAKLLDCSVGNSKSQLHKAKLRIREFLAEPGQEINVALQEQEDAVTQNHKPRRAVDFAKTASALG